MSVVDKAKMAIFNIRLAVILILIVVLGSMIVLDVIDGLDQIVRITEKIEVVQGASDLALEIENDMKTDLYGDLAIKSVIFILLIFEIGYTLGGKKKKHTA